MYRDLNHVYPDGSRYLGSPLVGAVASAIPSTGDHGEALAYDNVVANGWTTQRVLFWARAWTTSTLFVYDDSSYTATVPADGSYTVTGDIYLDDVLQSPQSTVNIVVGSVASYVGVAVSASAAATLSASAGTYTAAGGVAPTVSITLVDRSNNVQASQSGIYWALLDGLPPTATILAQGQDEVSDGGGVLSIDVSASGLGAGDSAWLVITDGAAAPNTKGRVVPVTVA